jgi:hypothetical protein
MRFSSYIAAGQRSIRAIKKAKLSAAQANKAAIIITRPLPWWMAAEMGAASSGLANGEALLL